MIETTRISREELMLGLNVLKFAVTKDASVLDIELVRTVNRQRSRRDLHDLIERSKRKQ